MNNPLVHLVIFFSTLIQQSTMGYVSVGLSREFNEYKSGTFGGAYITYVRVDNSNYALLPIS
jgi:hypothetical protein